MAVELNKRKLRIITTQTTHSHTEKQESNLRHTKSGGNGVPFFNIYVFPYFYTYCAHGKASNNRYSLLVFADAFHTRHLSTSHYQQHSILLHISIITDTFISSRLPPHTATKERPPAGKLVIYLIRGLETHVCSSLLINS